MTTIFEYLFLNNVVYNLHCIIGIFTIQIWESFCLRVCNRRCFFFRNISWNILSSAIWTTSYKDNHDAFWSCFFVELPLGKSSHRLATEGAAVNIGRSFTALSSWLGWKLVGRLNYQHFPSFIFSQLRMFYTQLGAVAKQTRVLRSSFLAPLAEPVVGVRWHGAPHWSPISQVRWLPRQVVQ